MVILLITLEGVNTKLSKCRYLLVSSMELHNKVKYKVNPAFGSEGYTIWRWWKHYMKVVELTQDC